MHSSRMHTVCGSSHLLGGLPQCMLGYTPLWPEHGNPPRPGPGEPPTQTPQPPHWVWTWRTPSQTPQPPHWVWAWRPPTQTDSLPMGMDWGSASVHVGTPNTPRPGPGDPHKTPNLLPGYGPGQTPQPPHCV